MNKYFKESVAWSLWVLANTASAALATIIILLVVAIPNSNEDRYASFIGIPAMFLCILGLQLVVLKRYGLASKWWLPANLAGCLLTLTAVFGLSRFVDPTSLETTGSIITLTIFGAVLGTAQWLVLRARLANSWIWIPASILGWLLLGFYVGDSITHLHQLVLFGTIPALATGAALADGLGKTQSGASLGNT